jgi:hypothetical protein
MATNRKWFPGARIEQNKMITKTHGFMAVESNRTLIGFGTQTPMGVWYDTSYVPKESAYLTAYQTWDNPATNSRMALDNLKTAEGEFFPLYREFYALVKPSSLVSDATFEALGFPPRPTGGHSSHPVDKLFIDINVNPAGRLALLVSFKERDSGSSTIPYYLTGAVIYYEVSDKPVTNPNHLSKSRLASHSPFELMLDPEQRSLTLSVAARWQNRRGELGPWSEIVTVIVP